MSNKIPLLLSFKELEITSDSLGKALLCCNCLNTYRGTVITHRAGDKDTIHCLILVDKTPTQVPGDAQVPTWVPFPFLPLDVSSI